MEYFIHKNLEKNSKYLIKNYNYLNAIKYNCKESNFPYNLLEINVIPTYKKIYVQFINSKNSKNDGRNNDKNKNAWRDGGDILIYLF